MNKKSIQLVLFFVFCFFGFFFSYYRYLNQPKYNYGASILIKRFFLYIYIKVLGSNIMSK